MAAHGVPRAGGRKATGPAGPAGGRARHQGFASARRWGWRRPTIVPRDCHQSAPGKRASARAAGERRWTEIAGLTEVRLTSFASVRFGARVRWSDEGPVARGSGRSGSTAGVLRHERRAGRGGQGPGTSGADAHRAAGRTSVRQGAGGWLPRCLMEWLRRTGWRSGFGPEAAPASGSRGAGPADRKGRCQRSCFGAAAGSGRTGTSPGGAAAKGCAEPWVSARAKQGGSPPRSRDRQASGQAPRRCFTFGWSAAGGPGRQAAVRSDGGRCFAAHGLRPGRRGTHAAIEGAAPAGWHERVAKAALRRGRRDTGRPARRQQDRQRRAKPCQGLRSGQGGARGCRGHRDRRIDSPALALSRSGVAVARVRAGASPKGSSRPGGWQAAGLVPAAGQEPGARGAGTGGVLRRSAQVLRHRRREAGGQANRAECSGPEGRDPRAQARGNRTAGPGADGSKALPGAASHSGDRSNRARSGDRLWRAHEGGRRLRSVEALAGEAPRSGERDDVNDARQKQSERAPRASSGLRPVSRGRIRSCGTEGWR
jgi:hypothetical protein